MTSFEIESAEFKRDAINNWELLSEKNANWPVVYIIDNQKIQRRPTSNRTVGDVYVGETLNAANRMRQHIQNPARQNLTRVRFVLDDTFNKSVCLDLESFLIRLLAGDGTLNVTNQNSGIVDANYYNRSEYQKTFQQIFDELRDEGLFTRTIPEIVNSDLFKLSPFKALTTDQAVVIEDILEGIFGNGEQRSTPMPVGTSVVRGDPGTGKTIVAIYLMKLLADIQQVPEADAIEEDSLFSDFFASGYRGQLAGLTFGIVVPQQSLRTSIRKVFKKTPGLHPSMVLSPFEVGKSDKHFDLLVVDETHRLSQRANQPSASQNKSFKEITHRLFGSDDTSKTQLDWIIAKSTHQVLLVDAAQSVRPADLPANQLNAVMSAAEGDHRLYRLTSQMRVAAGTDYIGYVRNVLAQTQTDRKTFGDEYELKLYGNFAEMVEAIRERERDHGLARLLAGYAWKWKSRKNRDEYDIVIDDISLRWNSTATDWVTTVNSVNEVGSIHTIQGYDLNYAGVIIGPDLKFDPIEERIYVDRSSYFDAKGKENNPTLNRIYTDDDLLVYVRNIYAVLMTRGIRGTFIYACDEPLREYLSRFFPTAR